MKITVGTPKELGTSGLFETPIEVKTPDGTENVTMYLTKDGRYLIRGEISDLTTDPLAETSAKIQTAGAPVLGDPKVWHRRPSSFSGRAKDHRRFPPSLFRSWPRHEDYRRHSQGTRHVRTF